jgi:hypothetical protein
MLGFELPVRSVRRALYAFSLAAVLISGANAQATNLSIDPRLVGHWSGESITDEHGVRRWSIERDADGSYKAKTLYVGKEGLREREVAGHWSAAEGVLRLEPAVFDADSAIWSYVALDTDCWQLQAVDPATRQPVKPALRFGECRVPARRPIPDQLHRSCVMNLPGSGNRGTLDLRIVREADGRRFVVGNGERDPNPLDVRDYPILREFDPAQVETMTNAGEGLLVLAQAAIQRGDPGFAGNLGFKPSEARAVRVYVMTPPRPARPMEYYSAGRAVVFEAFDASDRSLGMAMYMPFLVACPPAAP